MSTISNFPYFEIQFNKEGQVHDSSEVQQLLDFLNQEVVTDLIIISHGWNTDINDARRLYNNFFNPMRQIINEERVAGVGVRKFAILAVLWPSKKFAEQNLIPGGAASADSLVSNAVEEQLAILQDLLAQTEAANIFEQLNALVPQLEDSPSARVEFVNLVRSLLNPETADEEDASADFFQLDGGDIMQRLSRPIMPQPENFGEEEGGAAGIGDFTPASEGGAVGFLNFGGFIAAAGNLLNFATYYEMKQRSGYVGLNGLNPILHNIRSQHPDLKLHLVGHSFGGRLVTAAAMGTGSLPSVNIQTMSLLQAAFSHYGFADNFDGNRDGFFRQVIEKQTVFGSILITHTTNDKAVGLAYPIASALVQDDAAGLGDENDRFGGIGRNGAQNTPEAIQGLSLLPVGGTYQFELGKLHNLRADDIIKNHGDICKLEIAYAILTAVAMTWLKIGIWV